MLDTILSALPQLMKGLGVTITMAVLGLLIGFVIGTVLGLARFYGGRVANFIALLYGRIMRSIPNLVMVMLLYLVISSFVDLTPFASVVLALGLHSGAYQAEIIRGAIASVSKGEILAAQTLGMTRRQVFFNIIFPQLIINAIPGWTNEVAVVLKDTSIAFAVGGVELFRQAEYIVAVNKQFLLIYSLTGLIYLAVTFLSSKALELLDRHFRHMDANSQSGVAAGTAQP